MTWVGQRVLVTGAGGFIGSHLVERLVTLGAEVRAFVHYSALGGWGWLEASPVKGQLEVVAGDLTDRDSVLNASKGVQYIFHLGALIAIPYSYRAPQSYVRTNVEGTLNVLSAAREVGVTRMVHTSTSEVYGSAQTIPMSEAHPLVGQSPYSASKIAADKMVEAFHRSFGVPVATLRPFNTFGPRQSARAVVPTLIMQALARPEIRLGNLSTTRDLNFVADTVEGFIRMAEVPEAVGKTIQVGSGSEISIGALAQAILDIVGKRVPVVSTEERLRPGASEVERLCADNQLARSVLGWSPGHSLVEGLRITVAWMEKNLERYRTDAYVV